MCTSSLQTHHCNRDFIIRATQHRAAELNSLEHNARNRVCRVLTRKATDVEENMGSLLYNFMSCIVGYTGDHTYRKGCDGYRPTAA